MKVYRFPGVLLAMSIVAGVLELTGCASFSQRTKLQSFEDISKNYRFAVLMSDFVQASQIGRFDLPEDFDSFKNFHVVSYTLKKITFSEDKNQAFQTVEIEYYRVDSMRQKIVADKQEWSYEEDKQSWILTSGLPEFY